MQSTRTVNAIPTIQAGEVRARAQNSCKRKRSVVRAEEGNHIPAPLYRRAGKAASVLVVRAMSSGQLTRRLKSGQIVTNALSEAYSLTTRPHELAPKQVRKELHDLNGGLRLQLAAHVSALADAA